MNRLHSSFRIEGKKYTSNQLKALAYEWIKEGDTFNLETGSFILDWLDDSNKITAYTSGSTGKPKEIELEKSKMLSSANKTATFFNLTAESKLLHCLPSKFIAGKMMLVRAMSIGSDIAFRSPSNPLLSEDTYLYDFIAMTPMQVAKNLHYIRKDTKLLIGGGVVSPTLKERISSTKIDTFVSYGMTETITHIAIASLTNDLNLCYKAMDGVTFGLDARGCLEIEAPYLLKEKLVTNDMVTLLHNQAFHFNGRYDNVVNSGGIKLFPEKIERKLTPFISERFFVTGIPDAVLGEKLVLVIESEKGNTFDLENILSQKSLGPYERPKQVLCIPNFLETETGKIRRKETLKSLSLSS